MTDRHHDAARDLVRRAHEADPAPVEFDTVAGLANLLERARSSETADAGRVADKRGDSQFPAGAGRDTQALHRRSGSADARIVAAHPIVLGSVAEALGDPLDDGGPFRFDLDDPGSGLFGGPGADLFGQHKLPEQLLWTTGPQQTGRNEENSAADSGSLVRPYTRTGGRTRPDYDLAIEAVVFTSERGLERDAAVLPEHRSICRLCVDPRAVAEIAALVHLPIGVVRVLIGDMASMGLVTVQLPTGVVDGRPTIGFLQRVLDRLREL